jgi:hypothetical protein
MNMPRFTAEVSLYKTNGYYQTGREAINLSGEMIRTIHAAMEKIEVHSCAPGSYLVEYGDGTWDCWTNPDPWGGSGGGGGMPGSGGGEPGGGGPGGGVGGSTPHKKPIRPAPPTPWTKSGCTSQQAQSEKAKPCHSKIDQDLMNNVKNRHYFRCEGSKMECCQNHADYVTICDEL